MLKDSIDGVYKIFSPSIKLPLIFDSPHSGRIYPQDFNYSCPINILKQAEDNYVDKLFSAVPLYNAILLCAEFPRTYIDVNRSETDIDVSLLSEKWPGPIKPTKKSHSGIGLIRRVLRPGITIYNRKLRIHEIQHRINFYYKPYHKALSNLIENAHYDFGQCYHINCHSMPSVLSSHSSKTDKNIIPTPQPDFVIGTRDGTTCSKEFSDFIYQTLSQMGYQVALNYPYKGVELVKRYSRPSAGKHSLQLEINKALYWDEEVGIKNINYDHLQNDINTLINNCSAFVESKLVNLAAD
jgi:N-formylglutamate amidohydrolase